MDDRHFDTISRSLASRTSRRQAIRSGGAGAAILGVLGFRSARPAAAQDDDIGEEVTTSGIGDDGVCRLQFEANVRLGPSLNGGDTSRIAGTLSFSIDDDGGISDGSIETDDGQTYSVIGQESGRSIALRIHVGDDVLVAVGAGEDAVKACSGEYGGPSAGPQRGDLGDWIATAGDGSAVVPTASSGGSAPAASTDSSSGDASSSTPDCSNVTCESPLMLDPNTCDCVCYEGATQCGENCCPPTMICGDGVATICDCPDGTEYCNASCVSCNPGQIVDMGTCICTDNPCPGGGELCGTTCVDTVNDRNNCGFCENVCNEGIPCIAGNCTCPPGYSACPTGCEDLASDGSNCGDCGTVCGLNQICQNGTCF